MPLKATMPEFIAPQLCESVVHPPDQIGWVHEIKLDGYRVQIHVARGKAVLRTRKGLDWTHKFPETAKAAAELPDCMLICPTNVASLRPLPVQRAPAAPLLNLATPLRSGGASPRIRTPSRQSLFHLLECCITRIDPLSKRMRVSTRKQKLHTSSSAPRRESSGDTTTSANPYSIEVLRRAVDILAVFSHAKPSMSLAEIVDAVQLPKTTVFRVLSSLVERNYCEWDTQAGKYSLGFELVRLADIRRRQSNVHDIVVPVMREIRNTVNETVILSVRAGDARVHIDFVEGLHPMRRMADLGVRAPLYAGAASKVLLAGMEDDEIEAYLGRTDLTAFQKTTITDPNVLWRELRAIRKRGFAESKGELFPGGGALAAPIKDFSGKTVAVMDILTPEHRYTATHREHCITMLLDAARRASKRLGYHAEAQAMPAELRRTASKRRAR
jgi:IclR family acetate operon transcriptional repressor